jgi:hypothetical protein
MVLVWHFYPILVISICIAWTGGATGFYKFLCFFHCYSQHQCRYDVYILFRFISDVYILFIFIRLNHLNDSSGRNAAGDTLAVVAILDQPSSSMVDLSTTLDSNEYPASMVSIQNVYLSNVPDILTLYYLVRHHALSSRTIQVFLYLWFGQVKCHSVEFLFYIYFTSFYMDLPPAIYTALLCVGCLWNSSEYTAISCEAFWT